MGRYYTGDIEGKFWFAVQSSDDADNFGVDGKLVYWTDTGDEPQALVYTFTEDNLDTIDAGIQECLNVLGDYKDKMDSFFNERNSYTEEILAKEIGCDPNHSMTLLEHYARLDLGMKIKKCVEEHGICSFDAEL